MSLILRELWIYPVKSARGLRIPEAEVTSGGLRFDRRWMIVSDDVFLSQRECPKLATLEVALTPHGLRFNNTFEIHTPLQPPNRWVTVWDDKVQACDAGDAAARWLGETLSRPCRLVYMPDEVLRPTDPQYAPTHHVSFADGFPFLITCEASLADLNARLQEAIPMQRFRPNFVVGGDAAAFAEDTWRSLAIGACVFDNVKPCARCVIINTDQTTGARSPEPLRTLARYRRLGNGAIFGQNLVTTRLGIVRENDPVRILRAAP